MKNVSWQWTNYDVVNSYACFYPFVNIVDSPMPENRRGSSRKEKVLTQVFEQRVNNNRRLERQISFRANPRQGKANKRDMRRTMFPSLLHVAILLLVAMASKVVTCWRSFFLWQWLTSFGNWWSFFFVESTRSTRKFTLGIDFNTSHCFL